MKRPLSGFPEVADAFARKAQATRLRLAVHGVRCNACFTVALRPEVLAMRAAVARLAAARTSGLAPMVRTSGLVVGEADRASGTAPTEPALPSRRGPSGEPGGRR